MPNDVCKSTTIMSHALVNHVTGAGQSRHRRWSIMSQALVNHVTGAGQSRHRRWSITSQALVNHVTGAGRVQRCSNLPSLICRTPNTCTYTYTYTYIYIYTYVSFLPKQRKLDKCLRAVSSQNDLCTFSEYQMLITYVFEAS
jgi:hypothetical protein